VQYLIEKHFQEKNIWKKIIKNKGKHQENIVLTDAKVIAPGCNQWIRVASGTPQGAFSRFFRSHR
jgi:hypothetical protein